MQAVKLIIFEFKNHFLSSDLTQPETVSTVES